MGPKKDQKDRTTKRVQKDQIKFKDKNRTKLVQKDCSKIKDKECTTKRIQKDRSKDRTTKQIVPLNGSKRVTKAQG